MTQSFLENEASIFWNKMESYDYEILISADASQDVAFEPFNRKEVLYRGVDHIVSSI